MEQSLQVIPLAVLMITPQFVCAVPAISDPITPVGVHEARRAFVTGKIPFVFRAVGAWTVPFIRAVGAVVHAVAHVAVAEAVAVVALELADGGAVETGALHLIRVVLRSDKKR